MTSCRIELRRIQTTHCRGQSRNCLLEVAMSFHILSHSTVSESIPPTLNWWWRQVYRLRAAGGRFRIRWAPISSFFSPYGWIVISPSHITNSAFSPESFWLHVSLDLAGSDAMALLMLRPLLLSTSICLIDHGGLDRGPWLLPTIHTLCHTHWMWHIFFCPSWKGILLCCSPEGFFTFFPVKGFISIFWWFFLIRCEVKGQGCFMCTDCRALWGRFLICDVGLYKINWIELNVSPLYKCTSPQLSLQRAFLIADYSTSESNNFTPKIK